MLRYYFTLAVFPILVLIPLRWPFFGAMAILTSFVMRDVIFAERFTMFYTLHGVEVLYIMTFMGLLIRSPGRLKDFAPRNAVDYGMLGFMVVMLISAVLNGDPHITYNKYIVMFFKCLVLYFLVSRLTDTERRALILTFTLIAATSYLVYVAWDKTRTHYYHYARPYSFSSHHTFGIQLLLTLPLIAAMVLWKPRKHLRLGRYARWAMAALVPLYVLTGMRTLSRSTYLGVAVALACLLWYYRKKWRYAVLASPLILFAMVHQHERVWWRIRSIWTHRTEEGKIDPSIQSRFSQMRTAMNIFRSRPLLGIGPRQYFRRYLYWAGPDIGAAEGRYTMHCVPLLILCEEGIIGFAFYYGLIIGGALLATWRTVLLARARDHPALRNLAIIAAGCAMGLLSWMAFSLGQPGAWTINIYGMVALVVATEQVALQIAFGEAQEASEAAQEAPALWPGGATTEIVFT